MVISDDLHGHSKNVYTIGTLTKQTSKTIRIKDGNKMKTIFDLTFGKDHKQLK